MMKTWQIEHLKQLRQEQSPQPSEQPQIQIPLCEPGFEEEATPARQPEDTELGVVTYQM